MIRKIFPNIHSLWKGIFFGMLEDKEGYLDYFQRNIIHSHSNLVIAKSAIFDFDLGDIGLTPTKWSKFTGQYVDVEQLHAWVNNAMNVKTYDALWSFKIVPPNFGGKKAVHQWGNCLLGFSFRRQPKPPTLTLYTRAQSIGFSGVADYALTDFVARKIAERIGIDQSGIRFQLYCPNFMIKVVETVHILHRFGKLDEYLEREGRVSDGIRWAYNYITQDESNIRWRAARRMRTKYLNSMDGKYRSFPVANLTLKGWEHEKRQGRKMTAREAANLVLIGKGRRGAGSLVIPEEVAI